jgi:hypothetical protein
MQSNDPKTPLPAELQNDLLKIEADSSTTPEAPIVPETSADTPKHTESPASETPVALPKLKDEVPATETASAAPSSIVQQYKEQPSTGEQNTGAIYDTDSYHKTLVHPVKKKSGWLWVVWIAILLVVGGGVGAAMYFFVIPNL